MLSIRCGRTSRHFDRWRRSIVKHYYSTIQDPKGIGLGTGRPLLNVYMFDPANVYIERSPQSPGTPGLNQLSIIFFFFVHIKDSPSGNVEFSCNVAFSDKTEDIREEDLILSNRQSVYKLASG